MDLVYIILGWCLVLAFIAWLLDGWNDDDSDEDDDDFYLFV